MNFRLRGVGGCQQKPLMQVTRHTLGVLASITLGSLGKHNRHSSDIQISQKIIEYTNI